MPGNIPTPARTWNTSKTNINIPNTTANQNGINTWIAIWNALFSFATNPAVCKGSSSGTTAGMDGVNRLTTTIVGAVPGTAHSWMVAEFPQINNGAGGKLQICVDYQSTNIYVHTMWISAAAGFTGGSTTNRPTAADEQQNLNGNVGVNQSGSQTKLHIMQSTDGKCFIIVLCTTNVASGFMLITAPTPTVDATPTPGGWNYPWFVLSEGSFNPSNQLTAANLTSSSGTHHSARHGSTAFQPAFAWEGAAAFTSSTGPANVANGITGQPLMMGFGLWAPAGQPVLGRFAYIPDLYIVGDNMFAAAGGTIGVDDNHRQWAVFGNLVVPWTNDASIPGIA